MVGFQRAEFSTLSGLRTPRTGPWLGKFGTRKLQMETTASWEVWQVIFLYTCQYNLPCWWIVLPLASIRSSAFQGRYTCSVLRLLRQFSDLLPTDSRGIWVFRKNPSGCTENLIHYSVVLHNTTYQEENFIEKEV